MKISSTAKRLKQIMQERNLKQVDILEACQPYCKKYGVQLKKNDLSQYVSGKVTPKQNKLSILAMALNVNEVWLMGYDVMKKRNTKSANLDSETGHLQNLSPENREKALEYIHLLSILENNQAIRKENTVDFRKEA